MTYSKTTWVQNSPPYINATNLNKVEQGIEDAHAALDVDIATIAQLRALNSSSQVDAGEVRYIKGYRATADGGQGNVYYDSSAVDRSFTAVASTDLITASGHTFVRGDKVVFAGGSLPAGITAGTAYFVTAVSGNTFKLAQTFDNAFLNTPTVLNITADGSGTVNYADDGGMIFVDAAGRRWRRVLDNNTVSLRQFGAYGNDSNDDTVAINYWIQSALQENCRAKHELYMEQGLYKVTSTIKLVASHLKMSGAGGFEESSAVFVWRGNTTDPMFDLHVRECYFSDFVICPGTALWAGVRFIWRSDVTSTVFFVPSHSTFERIHWITSQPSPGPFFTYCVVFAGADTVPNTIDENNEGHKFIYCNFFKFTEAAVYFDGYSQAKSIYFFEPNMNAGDSNGKHLIQGSANGSQGWYLVKGGMGGYSTVSDFHLGPTSEKVDIDGFNSENSVRFLTTEFNNQLLPWPVTIRNCRWDSYNVASDGEIIQFGYNGPLIVEDNYITSVNVTTPPHPKIRLQSFGSTSGMASIRHKHNLYSWNRATSGNPAVNMISVLGGNWMIEDAGNLMRYVGTGASGEEVPIPIQGRDSVAVRSTSSVTLAMHDEETQIFPQLTANITVTLPSVAYEGKTFHVVRNAATPGAFTLTIQTATPTTIKVLPSATAAKATVRYDGSAWQLIDYGTL